MRCRSKTLDRNSAMTSARLESVRNPAKALNENDIKLELANFFA